jgi:hypothetical protein
VGKKRYHEQIPVTKKYGREIFKSKGRGIGVTVLDFWRWAMSDFVSNAPRGVLAEFIVARALGIKGGVRNPWDAFDLKTRSGIKIEVKSASYLQFWKQRDFSKIIFPIRVSRTWDHDTGVTRLSADSSRQADIYVFCVLAHKDKKTLNPLDLDQWEFYVMRTETINERFPKHKTVSLSKLERAGAVKTCFHDLRGIINELSY